MPKETVKDALIFFLSLCVTVPAFADPNACTSNQSALVSHYVTHNNEYGGHVNSHVLGQQPPPQYNQSGRTLFASDTIYEQAWEKLAAKDPPLYCAENPQIGHEAARSIDMDLASKECTSANGFGICVSYNNVNTRYVRFVFRAVQKYLGSKGAKWILFNAYPSRVP